jgi:hypothetical protein
LETVQIPQTFQFLFLVPSDPNFQISEEVSLYENARFFFGPIQAALLSLRCAVPNRTVGFYGEPFAPKSSVPFRAIRP